MFLSFFFYSFNSNILFLLKISKIGKYFYNFLNRKWFFDKIYNELVGQSILYSGYSHTYIIIDRGILEFLGPYGISRLIYSKGLNIKGFHSGLLYHSLLFYFLGVILAFFLIGLCPQLLGFIDINFIFIFLIIFFITCQKKL